MVAQIGVMQGYLGKVQGKIRIGSSISDVEKEFGVVQEDDEDNLIINGQAGLRIDSDAQNTTGGIVVAPDSKITEIYVYHESS